MSDYRDKQLAVAWEYLNAILDLPMDNDLTNTYQLKRLALDAMKEMNSLALKDLKVDMEQAADFNFVEHMIQEDDND